MKLLQPCRHIHIFVWSEEVHETIQVTLTKCHRLSGLNNQISYLKVLEAETATSIFHPVGSSWGLLLWLTDGCVKPVFSHGHPSMYIWVLTYSLNKNTGHTGLGLHLIIVISLDIVTPNIITFWGFQIWWYERGRPSSTLHNKFTLL